MVSPRINRMSQEEMSVFREVIVSVILSKKYICTCVLFPKVSEIELFNCTVSKLSIKRYYVLFLILVFIVQVTKLVQFTQYNIFSKIPQSASMHFATLVRTWCVARPSVHLDVHRAGDNIRHEIEQFVSCNHFCSVHFTLRSTL